MKSWRRSLALMSATVLLAACATSASAPPSPAATETTSALPSSEASAAASGSATTAAFTYQSDWGTFTLSPEIQTRVAQKVASGQALDIPVFSYLTNNIFFDPIRKGIEAAAKDLKTTSQLLGPADPNQPEMINQINSYLSRNPDGIAVIPGNAAELEGLIDQLIDSGLPVIVYNTEMGPGSKRLVYVGQDNKKAGEEAGKLLAAKLQAKNITTGTIAMFAVDATAAYSHDFRFPGFKDAVTAVLPNIKFGEPTTIGNDPTAAVGTIDAALRGKSDIVAMYVADEQVVAAGTWIKNNAKPGDYVVVGHNLLPPELQLVAGGFVDGLIGQNPYDQGYNSVKWLATFVTTGQAFCGVTCDSGYPAVTSADQAKQMIDSNCDGKGCG
jgi:ribose transport system substrate-binding protein